MGIRGYGEGTRFKTFAYPGAARTVWGKLEAMLHSVLTYQEASAKVLQLDVVALAEAQRVGDVLGAHGVLPDAFNTDVRPLLRAWRAALGLHPDPSAEALREGGGYAEKNALERGTAVAGGGHPS